MEKAAKFNNGFTLIELLITLVVGVILMTVAVPSFLDTIRNNRTATAANDVMTALNLVRSEAIKRGVQVTMRRKSATASDWADGWDIFTDLDADGVFDDDGDGALCETGEDCLLRTANAVASGYTLVSGATYDDWVAYLPSGLSRGAGGLTNDTFRLCDDTADTSTSRSIVVSVSGRPRVQQGTASCP